jgi:uncharacterized damage-inducible protein DinB
MKKFMSGIVSLVLLGGLSAAAGRAQSAPAAAPSGVQAGVQADVIKSLEAAEKELVALAEATPQEKYSWRPMEGVRSTSEVFTHVARGNYSYAMFLGVPKPKEVEALDFDKVTEKAQVVDLLKKSFTQMRQAVTNASDLGKTVKIFGGREMTAGALILQSATHAHEHLGQSIAYARVNHIVPPWTAEREEQQKKEQAAKKP